jgi:superfamily II DNA or RNA helicase
MVAGIQKLSRMDLKSKKFKALAESLTAVFFDEAHHAIAPTYKKTLRALTGSGKKQRCPVIGLTATPGRGITKDNTTTKALVRAFNHTLLTPSQFENLNPVETLQKAGILSRIRKRKKDGCNIDLDKKELEHLEQYASFSPELLKRVGEIPERNKTIIEQVTRDTTQQPTLVFACDIAQAESLAYKWREKGINARAITAHTHPSLRRLWIKDFTENRLRVLVNVGTLTTGFDAPVVSRLIMGRPTTSPILFEQMIGRGLRGPKFGGTEKCTIIDIVDSFNLKK